MNKLPISIGILSWKSKKTLKNTLNSYKNNGLFDISDDVRILFQEINEEDIQTAKEFNLQYVGLSENIGVGRAFKLLATDAKYSNILLLEHDWELIEDKDITYKRISDALNLLDKNFSCVRLRHRKNYGDPLYSRTVYENNELHFFDTVTQLYSPHLLDCIHWKENPEFDFPYEIQKLGDYFVTTSRWANWTNNPCVYKKDFYLTCITKFVGNGIELEENISKWWAENQFRVAQGEGLFKHNDIDKNKDYNIVDIFPYFNEEEILELRIKLLEDHVDKFIICEANRTHTGDAKEFTCKKTLDRLNINSSKIQVLEIDLSDFEEKEQKQTWTRERLQRDLAAQVITDRDICFVSDCDEIIDPQFLNYYIDIAKTYKGYILRAPLVLLSGRADLRVYDDKQEPVVCYSPFFCFKHHLEHYTLSDIREFSNGHNYDQPNAGGGSFGKPRIGDIFITSEKKIDTVGWHFTWMGDSLKRLNKYKSFMHYYDVIESSNFSSQEATKEFIENYIPEEGNFDVLGRKDHVLKKYPTQFLPSKVFEIEKIKNFLLPPKNLSIVQIGTNKAYDELSEFLNKNYEEIKFGLFVEPNGFHNESIKECYKKYNNIKIENLAIVPNYLNKKELKLYYNTGDGPDYAISSCKLEHVEEHTKQYNIKGEIQSINVPCSTLEDLLEKYNIKKLDWLLLDVEGLDAEILLSFNWDRYRIKRIEFEYLHLNEKSDEVCSMFFDLGYKKIDSLQKFNWAFKR